MRIPWLRAETATSDKLVALLNASPVALAEIDTDGVVRHWNGAAEQLLGWSSNDVIGKVLPGSILPAGLPKNLTSLLHRLVSAIQPPPLTLRCRHEGGRPVDVQLMIAPLYTSDGQIHGLVAAAMDVSERLQVERDLRFQACHDSLTHLPNHDMLIDRLGQTLDANAGRGRNTGLLVIDLEKFRNINDGLGRAAGDQLLAQIGPRLLSSTLRSGDLVARQSGDKFAVLLPGIESVPAAIEVAERMLRALQAPFIVGTTRVDVAASIGIAVGPEHGDDPSELLQHADTAMYEAKNVGADIAVYRRGLEKKTPTHFGLLGQLRRALDRRELVVYYQPKIDVVSGSWAGSEALVRWQHPTRGLVLPGEFMPVIETTGLINRLTGYVLDTAVAQIRAWMQQGLRVPISVNLSARNLHDATLPGRVMATLSRYQVPPELLQLEITETAIMHDADAALAVLDEFVDAGIGLSLDDFGTGYSSMSYLQRLPVSELKVDSSFVAGVVDTHADRALVRLAIDLGHSMGLRVVAEGVENADILRELQRLGCDIAQGYYLGRPMPAEKIGAWYADRQEISADIPAQRKNGKRSRSRRREGVG